MNSKLFFNTLCGVLCAGTFAAGSAAAEGVQGFNSTFSSPPFQVGETVVGVDGWHAVSNLVGNPRAATLESHSDGKETTGLSLRDYGLERTTSEKLFGVVRVVAVINVSDLGPGSLRINPILGGRVDIVSFGYQTDAQELDPEKSGIFYRVQQPDELSDVPAVILVPGSDLVEGGSYTITADIDLQSASLSLSVTGKKADGTALAATAGDISFDGKWKASFVSGLRVIGSYAPSVATALLESVSVSSLEN